MLENHCVPRERLKEYLAGWSDPDQSDGIEAHLSVCQLCEQTIVDLESDPETLVEFVRKSPSPEVGHDAALDSALSKARALMETPAAKESSSIWTPPQGEIGAYELIESLGRGGMGSVYLAKHRQLGKRVAIKLLPARSFRNDHFAARFKREIRAAGGLDHPAIVRATDAGEFEGTHYLVMEHIDGLDLSRIARLVGKLSIADACEVMRQVALGLSHAHAGGIVHRDVKPSNLMLSSGGDTKILDFGLARVGPWDEVSAELTTVGQLMGTLDYMAPEQAERAESVDYRADLYSLGATLFRLLCGRAPLAASPDLSPLAKLRLLATHQPPRLDTLRPDAPPKLVALVAALLARDPADRPASAAHVAEQLQPFTSGNQLGELVARAVRASKSEPTSNAGSAPVPVLERARAAKRNKWPVRWLIAAALLLLAIWSGVLITLETQKGQLIIDSEVGNVSVRILQDGQPLRDLKIEPGANITRVYAGKYQIEIDQGSDAVHMVDGDLVIQKGETKIAHLRLSKTDAALNADLPASDAKLKPGDALRITSITEPSIACEVVVLADSRIKAPLIGTVSVADQTIASMESLLNDLYKPYLRNPGIQLYRSQTTRMADLEKLPLASTDELLSQKLPVDPNEPMYEGKTLSAWLDVIARERSPLGLQSAFRAVSVLVSPQTSAQITRALLGVLPNLNGEEQVANQQYSSNVDGEAFGILRSANEGEEFAELLTQELKRGNLVWSRRILTQAYRTEGDSGPLVNWISENILAKDDQNLAKEAGSYYRRLLYSDFPAESEQRAMLQDLEQCSALGKEFWLSVYPNVFDPNKIDNKLWLEAVYDHAVAAMIDDRTEPKWVVQAAMILQLRDNRLPGNLDAKAHEELTNAIRRRLVNLSEEELYKLTTIDSGFPQVPEYDGMRLMISVLANKSEASLPMTLLGLAAALEISGIEEALARFSQVTQGSVEKMDGLVPPGGMGARLYWPSMKAMGGARGKAVDLAPKDILSYLIHRQITKLMSPSAAPEEVSNAGRVIGGTEIEWAKRQIEKYDTNQDGQLTRDEWEKMLIKPSGADINDDGVITVKEYAASRR